MAHVWARWSLKLESLMTEGYSSAIDLNYSGTGGQMGHVCSRQRTWECDFNGQPILVCWSKYVCVCVCVC